MAASSVQNKDLYTQLGLIHTFGLFTNEDYGRLGWYNAGQYATKLSYTPHQLAVAWDLLKAIHKSIEQVAATDPESIPQTFPVLSSESFAKMRQVVGKENAGADTDAGSDFSRCVSGDKTPFQLVWGRFLESLEMYKAAMEGKLSIKLLEDEKLLDHNEWSFPREETSCFDAASHLFRQDNKQAKEGVNVGFSNQFHVPIKFFHSLVLEAEKHGNVNEFWDLTNLDLIQFLPLLPFTRLILSLISAPNAEHMLALMVQMEDEDEDEDADADAHSLANNPYYRCIRTISGLETYQDGELSAVTQFVHSLSGGSVDLTQ